MTHSSLTPIAVPSLIASSLFVGGLRLPGHAKSLRPQPDGRVHVADGPHLRTAEHVGGFWVLEAADMDAALAWGQKAAVACRAAVDVRAFYGRGTGWTKGRWGRPTDRAAMPCPATDA